MTKYEARNRNFSLTSSIPADHVTLSAVPGLASIGVPADTVPDSAIMRETAFSMLRLAGEIERFSHRSSGRAAGELSLPVAIRIAEGIMKLRRSRLKFMNEHLFGEPAWDMLLDLFIHTAKGQPLLVKSCGIAANIPGTTTLRYISSLAEEGLVCTEESARDRRVKLVSLTEKGTEAVIEVIAVAARIFGTQIVLD